MKRTKEKFALRETMATEELLKQKLSGELEDFLTVLLPAVSEADIEAIVAVNVDGFVDVVNEVMASEDDPKNKGG